MLLPFAAQTPVIQLVIAIDLSSSSLKSIPLRRRPARAPR